MAVAMRLALLAMLAISRASLADLDRVDSDGWHTWQVDEPSASTMMCCFSRTQGGPALTGCNLDGQRLSFSSNGDCAAAQGTVQIYARLADGEPANIYVLSSNCVVTSTAAVQDHGLVSAGENIAWFRSVIEDRRQDEAVREQALFALVQTNSDAAFSYLDQLLSGR